MFCFQVGSWLPVDCRTHLEKKPTKHHTLYKEQCGGPTDLQTARAASQRALQITAECTKTYTNTRGYIIEGDLGQKISFFSSFRENQAVFPSYIHEYVLSNKVVPGQGYAREFKDTGFDYAMASGYFGIKPAKNFVVQFGHGKHFIGDGYRSLLLSDNAFNYPFLRIQTSFWKMQYTNLYVEMQDINYFENNVIDDYD